MTSHLASFTLVKSDSTDEQCRDHRRQYKSLIAHFTQSPVTDCRDGVVNRGNDEDSTPLSPWEPQTSAHKN